MSFLTIKGLVKKFGDFTAVESMDLDVKKGEFISLLGPSGCGKTTTLQIIAGLLTPTKGRVMIDGVDITKLSANKRQLGIVFQSYALFHHMTVFENVSFGLEMRKVGKKERKSRVMEMLSMVHLDDHVSKYPKELSGGQQQRVALARALVINPEVLLLDEPLSALDAKIREEMQLELRAIQQNMKTTTILVTHDQTEAMALSDRIAVMNMGRLVQVDDPYEAYEKPGNKFVSGFLGKSNMFQGVIENTEMDPALVKVNDFVFPVNAPGMKAGTPVNVLIRPEKVLISKPGQDLLAGTISSQIFLGSYWLLQVQTQIGDLIITKQNVGLNETKEGDVVGIDWSREEVRVMSRESRQ